MLSRDDGEILLERRGVNTEYHVFSVGLLSQHVQGQHSA